MSQVLLVQADALRIPLQDASVQCVVTSPPYFGLRDYGTGQWVGGDPECTHDRLLARNGRGGSGSPGKQTAGSYPSDFAAATCRCGAMRVDAQLGLEPTLDAYIAAMVGVFREVWRVLRPDGTLWLNISDSYAGSSMTGGQGKETLTGGLRSQQVKMFHAAPRATTLPSKNLCMVPARLALALQADGWTLRSEIVWDKPSCMPESVQDRPTRSHEMVYLFSKQAHYFYDATAIRDSGGDGWHGSSFTSAHDVATKANLGQGPRQESGGRNARSVWRIASEPTSFAHFATFPTELVRRCLLAGTSAYGCCVACGAPWEREVAHVTDGPIDLCPKDAELVQQNIHGAGGHLHGPGWRTRRHQHTMTDWTPTCTCNAPAQPCTVLDPFAGSGTTGLVARGLGRQSVCLDLSLPYLRDIARERLGLADLARWEGNGATRAAGAHDDLPLFAERAREQP